MTDIVERIDAIFARERQRPSRVTDAREIPNTYESITEEWLSDVLCRDVPGAKVASFRLSEPDDGTSNRRRIFLTYNKAGQSAELPATVFCKGATAKDTRITSASGGSGWGEVNFYRLARPRLDIQATEAVYADFDPDTYAYLIMMNDIGEEATFLDHDHDTTREQAESMVDTLANLHARFYESPDLHTESLPFRPWQNFWRDISLNFEPSCDQAFADSEHVMPRSLFLRRKEVWAKTMASAEAHATLPRTLIHSDVHLRNWFLMGGNRMGLHDWQAVTIGHWSRDYVYAITTALSIENRRAWEEDLLRIYLDKMAERGVANISLPEAKRNCRQQLMTALAFWTITLRPAPGMPDMQPEEVTWTFLERLYAAIDDHDALDSFG